MREHFENINFRSDSLKMVKTILDIASAYARQGYRLSLRQLYYQLVARALIENTERSYKRIGNLVSDARMAGYLDWEMIEDRGRETITNSHWDTPADIIDSAAHSFRIDLWEDQPNHVEVMVEKAALEGVLLPVCRAEDIRFTANRGYSSSSTMYEAGKRLQLFRGGGKEIHVLYLGDHDPSGIDMTRDVQERLELFSRGPVHVHRLALNMDQVEQWGPPENPAKITDSRADKYIEQFGESSWELDAVEPRTMAGLVRDFIANLRDDDLFQARKEVQESMREELRGYAEQYRKDHE